MSAVWRHESGAQRVANQARHIPDAEAVHDLSPVRLDGLDGQVQEKSDFFRALAAGDEPQYLALARSEHFRRGVAAAAALHVPFHDLARHRWAQPAFAAHDAAQRELELAGRRVLQ